MITEAMEQLDGVLSLETAPADSLTAEHRRAIANMLEATEDEDVLFRLAERAKAALDASGANLRARYAAALYQELIGQEEDAGRGFWQIARALVKQGEWEGVRELSLRGLPLWPDNRFIRVLISTWDHVQDEATIDEDFTFLRSLSPDAPDLLWYEAQLADDEGRSEDAGLLACQALRQYVADKEIERAEEALLRVLETETAPVMRELIRVLPRMASAGMRELLDDAVEMAGGAITGFGLDGELARALEHILLKRSNYAHLRGAYVAALANSLGGTEEIRCFIADCGLAEASVPLEDARTKFRQMFNLRPGAFVEHSSLGVGRISAHVGDFLIIDFEGKAQHRMALEIASRALRYLKSECLRVARFSEPEKIKQEIESDPASLLVRALQDIGGEAKPRDFRDCLAGQVIPDDDWSSWWKRAREAAAEDPRIDTSQVFRQVYRLPSDEDDEMQLPPLPESGNVRGTVSLINRLLRHHPEWEETARERYAGELGALATAAPADDAVVAVPLLLRWAPEQRQTWEGIAAKALRHEPGVGAGVTSEEQIELLRTGLSSDTWREAALSGLVSRFPAVRKEAEHALRERLEDYDEAVRELLMERRDWPATRMALVRVLLAGSVRSEAVGPWHCLLAIINVLALNPPGKVRQQALQLLDPQDALGVALRSAQSPEGMQETVKQAARDLTASETGLAPLVLLLSDVWAEEDVAEITASVGGRRAVDPVQVHFDPGVTLMTRTTFDQNLARIRELENLLSNELPKTIAHARSLGDLSENAEYHDAKERQGIADANLRSLRSVMETARAIEDLEYSENVVVAGTEVVIRDQDTGQQRTFWILGQGDSVQDANVINYQAPLGQALVGKRPGDVVTFAPGAHTERLEVLSVTRKLPD